METLLINQTKKGIISTIDNIEKFTNYKNGEEYNAEIYVSQPYDIYIINLDRRPDRIQVLGAKLKNANLQYTRISAIDGKKFSNLTDLAKSAGYADLLCLGDKKRHGHEGHTGCYLSHLKCWRQFLNESKYDKLLVLEDDADFKQSNFASILDGLSRNQVDFIWLNSRKEDGNKFLEKDKMPDWGTQGYFLNKTAAYLLHNILKPDSPWITRSKTKGFYSGKNDCLFDLTLPLAVKDNNLSWKWFTVIGQLESSSDISVTSPPTLPTPPTPSKNKLEFVHIPKTAGSAIEIAASNKGINWGSQKKQGTVLEEQPSTWWHNPTQIHPGAKTFTVVRNPYNRIVSEYNYKLHNPTCENNSDSLNNWVEKKLGSLKTNPHINDNHFMPMHKYIYDNTGYKKVDHVLSYENLDTEFPRLMQEYELDIVLPKEKINPKGCTMTVNDLSQHAKDLIRKTYEKDFNLFYKD